MTAHYVSKIEAVAAKRAALGSFGDLGPGALAVEEWLAIGLELPDVSAMRAWRLARVRAQLAACDYAGILITDPINTRYATERGARRSIGSRAQIAHNLAQIKAGVSFREFAERVYALPGRYRANRYSTVVHGVGVCDEYPAIYYPEDAEETGYDGIFEADMTICVESYVGEAGGSEGVKLEEQVLVTDKGVELLSSYPFEDEVWD